MHKTPHRNQHHGRNHDYDLSHDLEKIKQAIADATQDVRGKAGQYVADSYDDIKQKSAHLRDGVADYASEKPFKSLGIAALVGFIVGYIVRK